MLLIAVNSHGEEQITTWEIVFPGLKYKRTFSKFEIRRFLRELFTTGTRLNRTTASRAG
jgi:hypothetical protein